MTRIKICGITNVVDALEAVKCGADALGLVFASSPRKISPPHAADIIRNIAPFVFIVGVFVNERKETIERLIDLCGLHAVQLHGDETPQFCRKLRKKTKVIKAFYIKDKFSLRIIEEYDVDGYLLDSFSGGSGRTFNWDIALKAKRILKEKPLILSGGLNSCNIKEAIRKIRPYAVDVSTGVEKYPGRKDPRLLRRFIEMVREI
ncbi:MAG: phosphoribosylanthranilate isomerase [Candidatus Omnitrophica bacterium]|nr:phosphoribosylanthranilate isomerase [Candidatus Omnitrophota bacterium]